MWRARSLGVLSVVAMLAVLGGCKPRDGAKDPKAYGCTVSDHKDDIEVSGRALARVTAATSRRVAVLVDPSNGTRTYAGTRQEGVVGGIALAQALLRIKQSLGGLTPALAVSLGVGQTHSLAFIYERPDEKAVLDLLDARLPPSGWDRMIIGLEGTVAGSASAGIEQIIDARADGELALAAYATVEPGGAFSITRWWRGSVEAGAGGLVGERFGTPGFSGAVSTAVELRFDRDAHPVQLRTISERRVGDRLLHTTGLLDLAPGAPRVPAILAALVASPLSAGPSSGSVFFGAGNGQADLWKRMSEEATVVTARYRVTSDEFGVELVFASFGVGFRRTTTDLTLTDISIRPPRGERILTCDGPVDLKKSAREPARPEVLKPQCVPPAVVEKDAKQPARPVSECLEPPRPDVTVNSEALVFPELPVGEPAPASSVAIRNTGGAPLRIRDVSVGGRDPEDFTIGDNICPSSLAPGEQCAVTVAFSPTADGERRATLRISTNAFREPSVVGLLGIGVDDRPDLIVASARRSGTDLVVTVTNVGRAGSLPSSTRATFTAAGVRVARASEPTAGLAPDKSGEITLALPDACLSAPCDVVVKADVAGDVRERNEDNNDLITTL